MQGKFFYWSLFLWYIDGIINLAMQIQFESLAWTREMNTWWLEWGGGDWCPPECIQTPGGEDFRVGSVVSKKT
jgi:hypothetical protein